MPNKFYRLRDRRIVSGVCAGVAEYFNIDVLLVRIVWGVFAFTVLGLVLYLAAAVVLPER